jgi:hypothetical protein
MIRYLIFITVLFACSAPAKDEKVELRQPDISVEIFRTYNGGYGYNILVDNKLLVHQPHIPTIASNRSFETAQSARSVADLVVEKVRAKQMPPSLTAEEVRRIVKCE